MYNLFQVLRKLNYKKNQTFIINFLTEFFSIFTDPILNVLHKISRDRL